MLYPSINVLRTKADSKYTLVSLAAKRSRDIIDGKPTLVQLDINKPVSIATREIADDLITYSRDFTTEEEAESLAEGHSYEEAEDIQDNLANASSDYESGLESELSNDGNYWKSGETSDFEYNTDEEQ